MHLQVDPTQRYAKMRAHTATHLLHAKLAALFPQTKQAGSLVDQDYLRFDFYADNLLTDQQLQTITQQINDSIMHALPVNTQEMSLQDANKLGAKAFFEDKYGDIVRVVVIGPSGAKHSESEGSTQDSSLYGEGQIVSIELCGGTHVTNTKDIGAFVITGQETVASGIKRITAVTGPKVAEYAQEQLSYIQSIADKFSVPTKQLLEKIDKEMQESEKADQLIKKLKVNVLRARLGYEHKAYEDAVLNEKGTLIRVDAKDLVDGGVDRKQIVEYTRDHVIPQYDKHFLLFTPDGQYALIHNPKAKNISIKDIQKAEALQGGGNDQLIQGKDVKVLTLRK